MPSWRRKTARRSASSRARLPREAGEGDIVVHEIGEFKVDAEATAARRARIREKMEALWEK